MDMDLNNRLTEDETLEQAYDIFLELAADNLDPADIILFNLQFEERGGAELFDPSADWEEHVTKEINRRKQNLSSMNEHDKRRAEAEINRLEKQKQRIATQKAMTERRFSQQKEQELNLPKKRN